MGHIFFEWNKCLWVDYKLYYIMIWCIEYGTRSFIVTSTDDLGKCKFNYYTIPVTIVSLNRWNTNAKCMLNTNLPWMEKNTKPKKKNKNKIKTKLLKDILWNRCKLRSLICYLHGSFGSSRFPQFTYRKSSHALVISLNSSGYSHSLRWVPHQSLARLEAQS
jgi:hypothetical protein